MEITLAYPFDGHQPDETIDIDEAQARQLIRDGRARHVDHETRTLPELRRYAADHGIDLRGAARKDDVVAAIKAAEHTRVSPITVLPPSGTSTEEA